MVSDAAIGTGQQGSYVLVVNKDNVVEQKLVKTGQRQGKLRIVDAGLDASDWVVTQGTQRAAPGSKVAPEKVPIASGPRRRRRGFAEEALTERSLMISRFFIERPVLANVLALVMVLIGVVALCNCRSRNIPTWSRRPSR